MPRALRSGTASRPMSRRIEIAMLAVYGIAAAYLFGALMNMWYWPFATGAGAGEVAGLSYIPGAPLWENLRRFLVYTLLTSTAGWDTGRAITNTIAIVVLGPAVLSVLRRASRRARFAPPVTFLPANGAIAPRGDRPGDGA